MEKKNLYFNLKCLLLLFSLYTCLLNVLTSVHRIPKALNKYIHKKKLNNF